MYLFVDAAKLVVSQKKSLQFGESVESLILDLYEIITFQAQCEDVHQHSEIVVMDCGNGIITENIVQRNSESF